MTDAVHGSGGCGDGSEAVGPSPLSGEVVTMQSGPVGPLAGCGPARALAPNGMDLGDGLSPGGGQGVGSLHPYHAGSTPDMSQAAAAAGGSFGGIQHALGPPSSLQGGNTSPYGSQPQQQQQPGAGTGLTAGLQQLGPGMMSQQQQQQHSPHHQQQQQTQQQQQQLAVAPNVLAMLAALTASQPASQQGSSQGGTGPTGTSAGGAGGGLQLSRPTPLHNVGLTALATLAAKQQSSGSAATGGATGPGGPARPGSGGGGGGSSGGAVGAGNGSGVGTVTAAAAGSLNPLQAALVHAAAASALMAAQRSAVAAAVQHSQAGLEGVGCGASGDTRKRKRSSPSPPAAGPGAAAVARMVAGGTHHLGGAGGMLGPGMGEGPEVDKDSPCRNQTGYVGVRMRKWGMFAAEIRDGDKRRWLGSFGTAHEAGLAYDAAAIVQKGTKAKTNFSYLDYETNPRVGAETMPNVRWDLLPEEVAQQMAARAVPNKTGRLGIGAPAAARPRGSSRGPPSTAAAGGPGASRLGSASAGNAAAAAAAAAAAINSMANNSQLASAAVHAAAAVAAAAVAANPMAAAAVARQGKAVAGSSGPGAAAIPTIRPPLPSNQIGGAAGQIGGGAGAAAGAPAAAAAAAAPVPKGPQAGPTMSAGGSVSTAAAGSAQPLAGPTAGPDLAAGLGNTPLDHLQHHNMALPLLPSDPSAANAAVAVAAAAAAAAAAAGVQGPAGAMPGGDNNDIDGPHDQVATSSDVGQLGAARDGHGGGGRRGGGGSAAAAASGAGAGGYPPDADPQYGAPPHMWAHGPPQDLHGPPYGPPSLHSVEYCGGPYGAPPYGALHPHDPAAAEEDEMYGPYRMPPPPQHLGYPPGIQPNHPTLDPMATEYEEVDEHGVPYTYTYWNHYPYAGYDEDGVPIVYEPHRPYRYAPYHMYYTYEEDPEAGPYGPPPPYPTHAGPIIPPHSRMPPGPKSDPGLGPTVALSPDGMPLPPPPPNVSGAQPRAAAGFRRHGVTAAGLAEANGPVAAGRGNVAGAPPAGGGGRVGAAAIAAACGGGGHGPGGGGHLAGAGGNTDAGTAQDADGHMTGAGAAAGPGVGRPEGKQHDPLVALAGVAAALAGSGSGPGQEGAPPPPRLATRQTSHGSMGGNYAYDVYGNSGGAPPPGSVGYPYAYGSAPSYLGASGGHPAGIGNARYPPGTRGSGGGTPAAAAAATGAPARVIPASGNHAAAWYGDPLLPAPKRTSLAGGGARYPSPAVTGPPHLARAGAGGSAGGGNSTAGGRGPHAHLHPHGAVAAAYPPYGHGGGAAAAAGHPPSVGSAAAGGAAMGGAPGPQSDGMGGVDPMDGSVEGSEPVGGRGHALVLPPGYDPRVMPGAYPSDAIDTIDPYGPPPYGVPCSHSHGGVLLPPGHPGHYYTDPNGDAYYYDVPPYYSVEEEEEELAAAAAAGHPYAMSYYGVPPHPHMPPHMYHLSHGVMQPPSRVPYTRSGGGAGGGGSSGGGGPGPGALRTPHPHPHSHLGQPAADDPDAGLPGPDMRGMRAMPGHTPAHSHLLAYPPGRVPATGAGGGGAAAACVVHPGAASAADPHGAHGSGGHHASYPQYTQAAPGPYASGRRHVPSGGGGTATAAPGPGHGTHATGGSPPSGFGAGGGGPGGGAPGAAGHLHPSHHQQLPGQGHPGSHHHQQAAQQHQQQQHQHAGGGGAAAALQPQGPMGSMHAGSHHPHQAHHAAAQQQQSQQHPSQLQLQQQQQPPPHHIAHGSDQGACGVSDQTELYYQKFHELTQAIKKVAGEGAGTDGMSSGAGGASGAGLDDVIRNLSFFTGRR